MILCSLTSLGKLKKVKFEPEEAALTHGKLKENEFVSIKILFVHSPGWENFYK